MNKRIIILLLVAIIAIAMVVGCGNSPESVTTTIPEPVCAVMNNQLCVGDSAIFYDANLNADVSYYGLGGSGANYIYYSPIDDSYHPENGSLESVYITPPLQEGVYSGFVLGIQEGLVVSFTGSSFDFRPNIVVSSFCPIVVVSNCLHLPQ